MRGRSSGAAVRSGLGLGLTYLLPRNIHIIKMFCIVINVFSFIHHELSKSFMYVILFFITVLTLVTLGHHPS